MPFLASLGLLRNPLLDGSARVAEAILIVN